MALNYWNEQMYSVGLPGRYMFGPTGAISQGMYLFLIVIHQIFSLTPDTWPKTAGISEHILQFPKLRALRKTIWRILNAIAFIWIENMLEYSSLDIICFAKLAVSLELRSRKTVRFSEQIMSTDKYPSIFSP